MQTLIFRAPGRPTPLGALLARAMPGLERAALQAAADAERVRVDGRVERNLAARCAAGVRVRADLPAPDALPEPVAVSILARGQDWSVVDKPAGWPAHQSREGGPDARALVADTLGVPLEEVLPVHRLDAAVSGAWLVAHSPEAAARLGEAFAAHSVVKQYQAIAPGLAWRRGRLEAPLDGKRAITELEVLEERGPLALVALWPVTGRTHQLRRHLADLGSPVVGDRRHGGVLVGGGLRLRACGLVVESIGLDVTAPWPVDPWPDEPVFAPDEETVVLGVSRATIDALRRGHPWILTDTETTDPGRFEPGRLVEVRGPSGEPGGRARVEGDGPLAARLWSSAGAAARTAGAGAAEAADPGSGLKSALRRDAAASPASRSAARSASEVAERAAAALGRRASLLEAARTERTTAFRLVHGEADGLPGVAVDRFGSALRFLVTGRAAWPLLDPLAATLAEALAAETGGAPEVVEVIHLRGRPHGELECVRRRPGSSEPSDGHLVVRERGLAFHVDLGLGEPARPRPGVGLFTDQRDNRERVATLARGGRWLNLFAHTGAFSVALLEAGAAEVVSVDLSRPYLDLLEANLGLNGLSSARHQTVRTEARRFLERLSRRERFDGMILDPPTAAASGRRFWSVKRDGAALIEGALRHLRPGGHLLLCRNDRRARGTLAPLVRQVAKAAGVELRAVADAPPSPDYPRLDGFPEGDAFEGVLVHLAE